MGEIHEVSAGNDAEPVMVDFCVSGHRCCLRYSHKQLSLITNTININFDTPPLVRVNKTPDGWFFVDIMPHGIWFTTDGASARKIDALCKTARDDFVLCE